MPAPNLSISSLSDADVNDKLGYVAGRIQRLDANGSLRSIAITTLPIYATNAAARAGGLAVGELYRTGGDPDLLAITH